MAIDLLQGTLDLIVLKTLSWGPMHGFGIARWIQRTTADALQVEEGSLYPALYRMERDDWVEAEWGVTDQGRRAKFYSITPKGRRQLTAETRELATFIAAQWCATIPNVRLLEIDVDDVPWREELTTAVPEILDGELVVPSGPGWGCDVVEDVLRAHPVA